MNEPKDPNAAVDPQLPEWAKDFPNFWQDETIAERANGDASYLDLLAKEALYKFRAEVFPDNPQAAEDALHRSNAVLAYEQYLQGKPPTGA